MCSHSTTFPAQILFEQTDDHIHLEFVVPFNTLSSAILNGGFKEVKHIVNLNVPKKLCSTEKPDITLNNYCHQQDWQGITAGMMTAASMKSMRIKQVKVENVDIIVVLTTGLSNPRRAGDYAEYRHLSSICLEHDTINIILISTATFTPTAMVEAIMIITEAKAAALQKANIKSPISNDIATGTGTDSIIVASQKTAEISIEFCGKHTLIGELIGQLVIEAITDSIKWDLDNNNYINNHSRLKTNL